VRRWFPILAAFLLPTPAFPEEIIPLAGCYERVFDAAWMKAHPSQSVSRVALLVAKPTAPETPGESRPILADAMLVMWVKDAAYTTIGACAWEKTGLSCAASLSERRAPTCRSGADGLRDCRLPAGDPGVFELAQKGSDLTLTVRERLELAGPLDSQSFFYINADNAAEAALTLQPAPAAACR
jgi:hypothetical protein